MTIFTGTSGIDVLPPVGADSSGDDIMNGLGGNDTLLGGGGDDALHGGLGSDTLRGDDGNDILDGGFGGDIYLGGAGDDTVDYSGYVTGVLVNLFGGPNYGNAAGDVFLDSIEHIRGSAFDDILTGDDNGTGLSGQDGDDTIRGLGGNDLLDGGAGADQLDGGDGDDTLIGGAGADSLFGNAGSDTVTYAGSAVGVNLNLTTNINHGGDAEGDRFLDHIETVIGSAFMDAMVGTADADLFRGGDGNDYLHGAGGDDVLLGEGNNDFLYGEDGNDSLFGGSGVDHLSGGAGDDILRGGTGSADIFNGGDGIDTVTYDDSTAGVNVNLITGVSLGGTAYGDQFVDHIEVFIGSRFDDVFTGGAGADTFRGEDGNDILSGGAGADTLEGDAGIDTATYADSAVAVHLNLLTNINTGGDAQGDIFVDRFEVTIGSAFDDSMIGSNAIDTLRGGDGNDALTGGGLGDFLYGGNGDDALDGGSSNDWMSGGAGADTFLGGDQTDTVSYEDSSAGVTLNLTTNVNHGGDAEGDRFLDQIEVIIGSSFDDHITGSAQAGPMRETLSGGAGNDVLTGGHGTGHNQLHILDGGSGDDVLIAGYDQNSYTGGDGVDTVAYSGAAADIFVNLDAGFGTIHQAGSQSFTEESFKDHIEIIVGTAFDDEIIGSTLDDTLRGGAGSDQLSGGGGDDVLVGGAGADVLRGGGQAGDRFVYTAVSDSTVSARDLLLDFAADGSHGKVDLSAIDADVNTAGHQDFTFIGTSAFTGVAGQLRYDHGSAGTFVSGDVNGDKVADIQISMSGSLILSANDFIL